MTKDLGLEGQFPSVDIVRMVNDKCFSHSLEHRLGIGLPHSTLVSSIQDLEQAVHRCPYDWVLKHPFGVSGRERMLGRKKSLTSSIEGWARKRMSQGFSLIFEPWVEKRHDFSLHFDVSETGAVTFLGHCEFIFDPGGVHRGHRLNTGFSPHPGSLECGHKIVDSLAGLGYWGPVGIDSLTGILGRRAIVRPLVEINARCSFGLLALSLGDWLPQGSCYLWWHPSRQRAAHSRALLSFRPLPSSGSRELEPGYYRLPVPIDPKGETETVIVVAQNEKELIHLEEKLYLFF